MIYTELIEYSFNTTCIVSVEVSKVSESIEIWIVIESIENIKELTDILQFLWNYLHIRNVSIICNRLDRYFDTKYYSLYGI